MPKETWKKNAQRLEAAEAELTKNLDRQEVLLRAVKEADGSVRRFTQEEQRQFDDLQSAATRLQGEIDRLNQPESLPPTISIEGEHRGDRTNKRSYRGLFGDPARQSRSEFESLGEMLAVVRSGRYHPGLNRRATGASGDFGADGGFVIPQALSAEIVDSLISESICLSRADLRPMETRELVCPIWDTSDRTAAVGGFIGGWIGEGQDISPEKPKLRTETLTARKFAILCAATNELLSDAPGFDRELAKQLGKAAAFFIDKTILISGDGAGKPLALLNHAAVISADKVTSQTPDSVFYQNIVDMESRLLPECDKSAVWLASPSTKPQMWQLFASGDLSDSHRPILREQGNGKYTLQGRELIFTEHLKPLGDYGDLLLVDFSKVLIGMRKEIGIDVSQHLYFNSDESAFRLTCRLDSLSKVPQPVTVDSSGGTLSSFISLAERA